MPSSSSVRGPKRTPTWVPSAAAFLALSAAVALSFSDLLSADQVPSRRDLLIFFLPFKAFLAESLRAGHFPLWNPWTFLGTPFLATLQAGVLYPPSAILLLPFPLGFNLFLFFHYSAALMGCWLLFRERRLGIVASSIGTLTYVLGGYLVSLLNVTNHLQSAAWVPFVLFFWSRHLDAPSMGTRLGLVAAIAFEILGGAPETIVMTMIVVFGWGLVRTLPALRRTTRASIELAGIFSIAGALTFFQLLPTVELTLHSVRGSAFSFQQMSFWSLEPVSLLQLLFPHSASLATTAEQNTMGQMLESQVPWLTSLYVGLVPLCLFVVGLIRGRERAFWSVVVVLGVLLALGSHGPLLPHLYEIAPTIFGKFRYPEKFWFPVHLATAILCAEGAEQLIRGGREERRVALVAASTFISIGLVILVLRGIQPWMLLQVLAFLRGTDLPLLAYASLGIDFVFKAQRLVIILATFSGLLLLEHRRLIGKTLMGAALIFLTAGDLGGAHHNLNLSVSWSDFGRRPPLVDVAALRRNHLRAFSYQTVSSARWGAEGAPIAGLEEYSRALRNTDNMPRFFLSVWPILPVNTGILHHVGTIVGGDSIDRAEIEMLRDVLATVPRERAVRLLRTYSVGALAGSAPLEVSDIRFIGRDGSYFAYEIEHPAPRAYVVSRLEPAPDLLAAFNRIIAPDFDPRREAVVDRLPHGWRNGGEEAQGDVIIERYTDDRVTLRSRATASAFLVLNDSFFPGWEAFVDGESTEIFRTNALVRGIVVPAGDHQVRFVYRPLSFRLGAGISLATGIILLTWIMLRSRGRGSRAS